MAEHWADDRKGRPENFLAYYSRPIFLDNKDQG